MVSEEARAAGAGLGGMVVAAGVSLIPIVGGSAAVFVGYLSNIPATRMVNRTLGEIQAKLDRMSARLDGLDPGLVDSEEFNAALMRVIRVSLETADGTKRAALRHALINGYILEASEERDRFLALVADYEPWHIAVLASVRDLTEGRSEALEHAGSQVAMHLNGAAPAPAVIQSALRQLVADGLLWEFPNRTVRTEVVRTSRWMPPREEMRVHEESFHSVTNDGLAFLAFIADPEDEGAPDARP